MAKPSAGLLMFRKTAGGTLDVLLVHPGGPFWMNKDLGAWSIPKGELEPDESSLEAAQREFEEEMGITPRGDFIALGEIHQAGGKVVHAWAFQGDFDVSLLRSNTFSMVWPPNSDKLQDFPEIDRAEWFPLETARSRINKGQIPFLDRLAQVLEHRTGKGVEGQ